MRFSRSCRYNLSIPVMIWASIFLLFLARGVSSASFGASVMQDDRYPRFDAEPDTQKHLTSEVQENHNIMQFLHELMQMQQQRSNIQQQMYNNGEELSENQVDLRRVPLPLLYQIRALINDESKEEDKRGSYMSLCHFKICNLG